MQLELSKCRPELMPQVSINESLYPEPSFHFHLPAQLQRRRDKGEAWCVGDVALIVEDAGAHSLEERGGGLRGCAGVVDRAHVDMVRHLVAGQNQVKQPFHDVGPPQSVQGTETRVI